MNTVPCNNKNAVIVVPFNIDALFTSITTFYIAATGEMNTLEPQCHKTMSQHPCSPVSCGK